MRPKTSFLEKLKFSKPVTPGFGLSKDFFVSVLAAKSVLPTLRELANPKGEGGAVKAYLAPMQGNDRSALERPMVRGVYALASLDRKSVFKIACIPRDEAHFDPAPVLNSPLAATLSDEARNRIAATWHVIQLGVESHDPMVYPALEMAQDFVIRLAELADGVMADSVSRFYRLPEAIRMKPRLDPKFDVREHVSVVVSGDVQISAGMLKFGLPEISLLNVPDEDAALATKFLLGTCQHILLGHVPEAGNRIGKFTLAYAGTGAPPSLELIADPGFSVSEALHGSIER